MPHLVILYTANLDREADISGLCRSLCDTMLAQRDESGKHSTLHPLFDRA